MKTINNPTANGSSKNEIALYSNSEKRIQPRNGPSAVVPSWAIRSPWSGNHGRWIVGQHPNRRSSQAVFHRETRHSFASQRRLSCTEADFWIQYNELGGIQDAEVPGGTGNPLYTAALAVLDEDMDQYIHDNTDDEITHHHFLNAYLVSKGAAPANLDPFRTLMGSTATGVNPTLIGHRLTNLTQLTVDTSWWTRYRDDRFNPDLDPNHVFPQAVPTLG